MAGPPYRLLRGLGLDDERLAQVHETDPARAAAEDLLAQQRIELHTAEPLLLLVHRWDPAGLVVDDLELTVGD